MLALIVADGTAPSRAFVERLMTAVDSTPRLVIAADGGARTAIGLGLKPAVVIGDGDSLLPSERDALVAAGADVVAYPTAKEESDTELCVREALRRGASRIVIIGAFGGARIEHTIANVLLLTLPDLAGADAELADESSSIRVLGDGSPDSLVVNGHAGDYVSLMPLSDRVDGVTTEGLAFPLRDETLLQGPTRGLSNEMTGGSATVTRRAGRLAVIHTRSAR